MLRTKMLFASLFLLSALVLTAVAQNNKEITVTTTIEGVGLNTTPTLRIQSDQLGPYKNSRTQVSHFQKGTGDWELATDSSSSSTRTVLIDFRDSVPGTTSNPPFVYKQMVMRFICKCTQYDVDIRNMIGVGTSVTCPLFPSFEYGGFHYRINMDGRNFSPGTDPATITCKGVVPATNQCNQWKFESTAIQANGERKNIGRLVKVVTTPKNTTEFDMGSYYFSFAIDVTNP